MMRRFGFPVLFTVTQGVPYRSQQPHQSRARARRSAEHTVNAFLDSTRREAPVKRTVKKLPARRRQCAHVRTDCRSPGSWIACRLDLMLLLEVSHSVRFTGTRLMLNT